ncbi:MAG: Xaa-Pro peptidase family protein [Bryobacterales bacterium]
MLKLENCRDRQQRLLRLMQTESLVLVVLTNPKSIYYFSGALLDSSLPHAFVMKAGGPSLLITNAPIGQPAEPPKSAADDALIYEWHSIERDVSATTWHSDVAGLAKKTILRMIPRGGSVGVEAEFLSAVVAEAVREGAGKSGTNITRALSDMRRQKDPDEIECIRRTVELAETGFAALKSRLAPGMTEFKAYSIFYDAMVAKAETSVTLNGDFACGVRAIRGGGPPTNRRLQFGDLYILDIYPSYQGYMCDFTRTFVIGGPSQLQQDAWGHVMEAHAIAHRMIHPGVPTRDVYDALKRHLDKFKPAEGSFWHHAGHGVGMNGWELPWLTPGSEDVIRDREVLACEPGLYDKALQGGIRLEHNYLVTNEGVTTLDHFPMELF